MLHSSTCAALLLCCTSCNGGFILSLLAMICFGITFYCIGFVSLSSKTRGSKLSNPDARAQYGMNFKTSDRKRRTVAGLWGCACKHFLKAELPGGVVGGRE